jgi:hypothetical protein
VTAPWQIGSPPVTGRTSPPSSASSSTHPDPRTAARSAAYGRNRPTGALN